MSGLKVWPEPNLTAMPDLNKPLMLNKMIRLKKASLYTVEFADAEIIDYDHLLNSAGEMLDYDRVTKKLDISPNNSSLIKITKLCAAISSC